MVQLADALWFVVIYTVGAHRICSCEADVRLIAPLLVWLAAYTGCMVYFVPRLTKLRRSCRRRARAITGRIVDSYTNVTTVKLFAHTQGEDEYARGRSGGSHPRLPSHARLTTLFEVAVIVLNGFLIVATCGLALWLWSQNSISLGAVALATTLVIRINNMAGWIMFVMTNIFENIGMVQEGMETISQAYHRDGPARAPALAGAAWRGALREDQIPLRPRRRADRGPVAGDQAGREGGAGRTLGRRQIHASQPAAALS